jgi:hypothetical protein
MKKTAKKKSIKATQGKTTTGVVSNYAGFKGKPSMGKKSKTGAPAPAMKRGGMVKSKMS